MPWSDGCCVLPHPDTICFSQWQNAKHRHHWRYACSSRKQPCRKTELACASFADHAKRRPIRPSGILYVYQCPEEHVSDRSHRHESQHSGRCHHPRYAFSQHANETCQRQASHEHRNRHQRTGRAYGGVLRQTLWCSDKYQFQRNRRDTPP